MPRGDVAGIVGEGYLDGGVGGQSLDARGQSPLLDAGPCGEFIAAHYLRRRFELVTGGEQRARGKSGGPSSRPRGPVYEIWPYCLK